MTTANWDRKFMQLAEQLATWSKDRSRRVGCIVVGPNNEVRATGYNGFPRGVDDSVEERYERPAKYKWTEHSERNAIFNAARVGVSLAGCRLYGTTLCPCAACARGRSFKSESRRSSAYLQDFSDPFWREDFRIAQTMFREGGVLVVHPEEGLAVG